MSKHPLLKPLRPALRGILLCLSATLWLALSPTARADALADARTRREAGDLRAARVTLQGHLQAHLDDRAAYLLLAEVYLDSADPAAAEQALLRAMGAGTPRSEVLAPLAQALLDQGQTRRLLAEFRADDAPTPRAAATLAALRGEAFLREGEADRAEAEFADALVRDGTLARARVGQAHAALQKDPAADVGPLVQQALAAEPKAVVAWELLAERELAADHKEAAEQAYGKALMYTNAKWKSHYQRALVRIHRNDLAGAEEDLAAAEKGLPQFAQIVYGRALLDFVRRDMAKAYDGFEAFLRIVPDDTESLYYAGVAAYAQGRFETAQYRLAQYMAKVPGSVEGRRMLATALIARKDFAGAAQLLAPLAEHKEADPVALRLLFESWLGQRRYEDAEQLLDRLPDNAPQRASLARAKVAAGDPKGAQRVLQKAAAGQPPDPDRLLVQVEIQLAAGDAAEAKRAAAALLAVKPDDPIAYNALGSALYLAGDLDAAEPAFRRALALQPGMRDAAFNLARIAIRRGNPEMAKTHLKQVLERTPQHRGAILALVELDLAQGQKEAAMARFDAALAQAPDDSALRAQGATQLLAAGLTAEALRVIDTAPSAQGSAPALLAVRGAVELAAGRAFAAVDTYQKLVNQEPDSAAHRYRLAAAFAAAKNVTAMQQELLEAVRLDGKNPLLGTTLAHVMAKLPDPESRSRLEKDLSALIPGSRVVESTLGDVALSRAEYPAATAIFTRLVAAEPNHQGYLERLVKAQRGSGDRAGAEASLRTWLAKHPQDAGVLRMLAQVHEDQGQRDQAIKVYQRVVAQEPNDAVALNNLAMLLRPATPRKALEYAERAQRLAPESPALADTLGSILLDLGETARALPLLAQAYKGMDGDPGVAYRYAAALAAVGKATEARGLLLAIGDRRFSEQGKAEDLLRRLSP